MVYEHRDHPEFSWSQSRRSTFRQCPRMYFWQYYGSHNGWYDDADDTVRLAYRLKKLTSFYEFLGGTMHELAADAIRGARGGERPLTADELFQAGRDKLNRAYAQSKRLKDWKRRPNRITMFHDFYYGTGPSKDMIDRLRDRLRTCTDNLLTSESYREAVQAPYVEVKEVDRGPEFFTFDGYTIWAQPDLLYRTGDSEYHVVDWKTGQTDETHPLQLRTYGLYVQSRTDLDPGAIVGRLEYLLKGTGESVPLGAEELTAEEREIKDSIALMQKYIVNSATNEPRPKESFPLKDDTSECRYCKFYELCEEELEGAVAGPF